MAICSDDNLWSHANRPRVYQLDCPNGCPVQFISFPIFATPAIPDIVCPCNEPSSTFATVDPCPFAYVSAFNTSLNNGPMYTRWVAYPKYSCVSWNSINRGVFFIDPNNGENGSLG